MKCTDLCNFNECENIDDYNEEGIVKRGSRNAAYAAKALRWRVDHQLKYLIKKWNLSS